MKSKPKTPAPPAPPRHSAHANRAASPFRSRKTAAPALPAAGRTELFAELDGFGASPASAAAPRTVTALAAALGFSAPTVRKLLRTPGCPLPSTGKPFDAPAIARWIADNDLVHHNAGAGGKTGGSETVALKNQKLRLQNARIKMENAARAGELVEKTAVVLFEKRRVAAFWSVVEKKFVNELPPTYKADPAYNQTLARTALREAMEQLHAGKWTGEEVKSDGPASAAPTVAA